MCILITNIQRFSLHDGPGIRTTVFLKGCSLRCPWCSNPENLNNRPQKYIKDGISGTYGCYYTSDELARECLKDKNFYNGKLCSAQWNITSAAQIDLLPGGVTFSGGEALLQIHDIFHAIKTLHENNIHIAAETCLFVPEENLMTAIECIDLFYIDIKILDVYKVKEIEKGNLDLYLSNLHTLLTWRDKQSHVKPVVIRIPVIGTYTDDLLNRTLVHDLIAKYKNEIIKIELIKEHNLGESKYKSLNMKMSYHGVEDSLIERYRHELANLGIPIEVCTIS